jgi:type I restriction enzyme S subunit
MSEDRYRFPMPSTWAWATLADVSEVIRGASPRPKGDPRYFGGDIPWIMISDISREPGKYLTQTREGVTPAGAERSRLLQPGALILSNSGTVCVPKILRVAGCIHDGFVTFPTLPEAISKDFLYHWFHYIRPKVIQANKQGITQVNLNTDIVRELPIPICPLPEQHRIVEKIEELFSDLDAGVASLERAKANLKRYRASVLKSAVEGKLTEEWRKDHPQTEDGQMLLDRILRERREKWEKDQLAQFKKKGKEPPKNWQSKYEEPSAPDTSELPKLPEGWVWATVEQVIAKSEYGTSVKCDYNADGLPVLRIPNISEGRIVLDDLKRATQTIDLDEGEELRLGDLLMCRTNGSIALLGKTALVANELDERYTCASYLLRFRFVNARQIPSFTNLYLTSRPGRSFIEGNCASSAGQHNISLSVIHRMPIPLPPLAEQDQIVALVEERLSQIDSAEKTIDAELIRSKRLRQSILKRAFEGKLIPQDPKDEPASVLLERIKASREAEQPKKKAKKVKAK